MSAGPYLACVRCREPFSEANTWTPAGWRETRLSGLCERCFDEVTREPDSEGGECRRALGLAMEQAVLDAWQSGERP